MDIRKALADLAEGRDLSREDMRTVMHQVMSGEATEAQIGGLLMALRLKGESIDEITAAVEVMRELASGVKVSGRHLVDIVGTGGDGANLFNVSTAASLVVAAAGGQVAKHGNRSVSSRCGSADLLEAAGVRLDLNPEQVAQCVHRLGVGFMFAPSHHSAMKHAIGPRKQLGVRTLFNVLGPMTNPAGVSRQLIGVYDAELCLPVTQVLQRLGAEHVMVVHSADGLDEISIAAETHYAELAGGDISRGRITPQSLNISHQDLSGLSVTDAQQSLALIQAALTGSDQPQADKAADMIALNAAAAIYVAGLSDDIQSGLHQAKEVIASGAAWERLQQLAALSHTL